MKIQVKNCLVLIAIVLGSNEILAQENIVIPKQEKLSVSGSDGDYESIIQKIQSQQPSLNLDRVSMATLGKREIRGSLVYTVKQNGKVIHQSERIPVEIQEKAQTLNLNSNGLEESMISTWEKQGFVRRQIGRIDDPEAKTGSLPNPMGPGSGKSGGVQNEGNEPKLKVVDKTGQQGFTRRQIGRIPISEYEVEVTFSGPNGKGNSQPSSFLILIN
ncbi:hypothetical protein [Algoriphagus litoralis]|uniref:hypothetical protein n=1 Tax=Algoriphagus litoralis TaxID=2202829 RepID=UPI000DB9F9AA|nr:hypothetical protein [Algoriphagus litoralis]